MYVKQAKISTDRENHKTNKEVNDSIIIKRFIFEFINRFFHFFYLAYLTHDFEKVK
jgi:anoctamin-10